MAKRARAGARGREEKSNMIQSKSKSLSIGVCIAYDHISASITNSLALAPASPLLSSPFLFSFSSPSSSSFSSHYRLLSSFCFPHFIQSNWNYMISLMLLHGLHHHSSFLVFSSLSSPSFLLCSSFYDDIDNGNTS